MKTTYFLAPLCVAAAVCSQANAQFYKLHNVDLSGGAIGQFTPTLTSNSSITNTATESFGGIFSVREHPFSFAGVEVNYAYTELSERYSAPNTGAVGSQYTARTQTDMHEATAAYLFHANIHHFQPYIAVGGGALDFVPKLGQNQWRGAGLVQVGFDIPTSNPHMGFRVMGRSLIYRAPNYFQPNLGSKSWVATVEPSLGVFYRF